MYNNIQGITKKKDSLVYIMEELDADVCLLAETMTCNVKVEGCRCITARKSVGQNVCIILRNDIVNNRLLKLYEPNNVANMIGVRIELMSRNLRIYTAHFKQQSGNSREDIVDQFEEMRKQFQYAHDSKEGMIMAFDANVHVGADNIPGCTDLQDWGGRLLMEIIESENLFLLNASEKCVGVVTRLDPRNGKESTIDLVICNSYIVGNLKGMHIDEEGKHKLTNYGKSIKTTDHNTIALQLEIKKCVKTEVVPYINTRNEDERQLFKLAMTESDMSLLFSDIGCDINNEFSKLNMLWQSSMNRSFKKIVPKRNSKSGITKHVRELMRKEKWVRENVLQNPERGRQISEITNEIRHHIERNRAEKVKDAINLIKGAKNPSAEIFKIRKKRKRVENVGFPLKDDQGHLQVSKMGVDEVINKHFRKVFAQNPTPEDMQWKLYWNEIDEIFDLINLKINDAVNPPDFHEAKKLFNAINVKKAVLGDMTADLVKLLEDPMVDVIQNFITKCLFEEEIPDAVKLERMALLYKNAGELSDVDNFRGIFLRHILLSSLQKWLYGKSSPILDRNGSESAFGGRKGRAVNEVLLIVRLIQDHFHWTGQPLVLKFLDVKKFFDTMNYKKCLIEAFRSGLKGKYWKMYKIINECKECVPYTPLGDCETIKVDKVFVQGSSDAMLMAWNLVDSINKKEDDVCDPVFIIEGVSVPRLLFVDDIIEMARSIEDTNLNIVSNETFEKENRINFKPSKCKLMLNNVQDPTDVMLNGIVLEVVKHHTYLGTIVSEKGRDEDLKQRIKDCNGVLNEIVEVCNNSGIGDIRLQFVRMLTELCFKSKFRFGCEVWDTLKRGDTEKVNKMIPNMIKRVLEVPRSTPTTAIQHDFGIVDLSLETEMERILLALKVLEMDDNRIAKRLLEKMLAKDVPGFCASLKNAMEMFKVNFDMFHEVSDNRKVLKDLLIEMQTKILVERMALTSKTDRILLGFSFNGKVKKYLLELPFQEARVVFMYRSRMFPTRTNFPNRWSNSLNCRYCRCLDTDEHLFRCCGFIDIVGDCNVSSDCFFDELDQMDTDKLSAVAQILVKILERMEIANEDKDLST